MGQSLHALHRESAADLFTDGRLPWNDADDEALVARVFRQRRKRIPHTAA